MTCTKTHAAALLLFLIAACCRADSVEMQDNPVADGTIRVADGDTDRSDWGGIPWYEIDEDFDEYSPVDIDRVQIATIQPTSISISRHGCGMWTKHGESACM